MKAYFSTKKFTESTQVALDQAFLINSFQGVENQSDVDSDIDDGVPCNYSKPSDLLKGPKLKYKNLDISSVVDLDIEDEFGFNCQAEKVSQEVEKDKHSANSIARYTDLSIHTTPQQKEEQNRKDFILSILISMK